ncbi:MAG: zinc-dependent metalloprotease [Acidobacteriota bacterium]
MTGIEAYGVGVGEWDKHAIRWAYAQFPAGADEPEALESMVRQALESGLFILSDADARPAGAAHPLANLWDNGADPVEALVRTLAVRRIALDRFGESAVPDGTPLAELEEVLVPLYLHHRYQLQAAVKVIGGLHYAHARRGDGQRSAAFIDPAAQFRALDVVLSILDPATLDLPESLLLKIPPRPPSSARHRELFRGRTDPVMDPLSAAATAADMVVKALLQRERAARLVDFHRRDGSQPGLEVVLDTLIDRVFQAQKNQPPRLDEIRRVTQTATVGGLIELASNPDTALEVRGRVDTALAALAARLGSSAEVSSEDAAHQAALAAVVNRYMERAIDPAPISIDAPAPPPGDPI